MVCSTLSEVERLAGSPESVGRFLFAERVSRLPYPALERRFVRSFERSFTPAM